MTAASAIYYRYYKTSRTIILYYDPVLEKQYLPDDMRVQESNRVTRIELENVTKG